MKELVKQLRLAAEVADYGYTYYLSHGGKSDPKEECWIEALNVGADAIERVADLKSRLALAERDAKEMAENLDCSACNWCEYFDPDYSHEACKECRTYNEGFKLRSVPENTKEETE